MKTSTKTATKTSTNAASSHRTNRVLAIVMAVSFAAIGQAIAQSTDAPPLPPGVTQTAQREGITEYRLANGLKIVLDPMPARSETVLHIVYDVGARDDVPGRAGYAHLLEHMLFKGTPKIPHAREALQSQGIWSNATTGWDRTDYVASFAARPATLDWMIDFEADRMTQAGFTARDLQTEMTVVRNEFEIRQGKPEILLADAVRGAAEVFHPYGRPPVGQRDDIEHVDFAALRALYQARYRPDNATIVIAGRFDVPQALSRIAGSFGKLPLAAPMEPAPAFVEPPQRGEREVRLYQAGAQSLLDLAYHVPAARHADGPALVVLAQMLASDGPSALGTAFLRNGRTVRVAARMDLQRDPALFWIELVPASGQALASLRDDAAALLEGDLAAHLDEAALKAAQQRIASFAQRAGEQPEQASEQLVEAISRGDWRLALMLRDACAAVTLADVQRVSHTYLSRYNRVSGLMQGASAAVGVEVPAAPALAGQLAEQAVAQAAAASSAAGPRAAASAAVAADDIPFDPTSLDFSTRRLEPAPGLHVAVLRKRLANDQARVQLRLRFGTPAHNAAFALVARLMPQMLMAGTATSDQAAVVRQMTDLGMFWSIHASQQGLDIDLRGRAASMPAAIAILADLLKSARLDDADLQLARQTLLNQIATDDDKPGVRRRQLYSRLINTQRQAGPTDAVYRWESPLLDDALRRVRVADLKRYQQAVWSAPEIRVAALGDIDANAFAAALQHSFADRLRGEPYVPLTARHVDIPGQRLHAPMPGAANVSLDATQFLSLRASDPDYWPLAFAMQMLAGRGESRLWHRLRDQLGASYDVNGEFGVALGEDNASFSIQSTFAPSQTDVVLHAIADEIDLARRDGFRSTELDRAKRSLPVTCPRSKDTEDFLVCLLSQQIERGQTFADWGATNVQAFGVTEWQASQALRKYIDWKRFVVVTAGDVPGAGAGASAAATVPATLAGQH